MVLMLLKRHHQPEVGAAELRRGADELRAGRTPTAPWRRLNIQRNSVLRPLYRVLTCVVLVILGAWPALPCDCVCDLPSLDAASAARLAAESLEARHVIVLGRVVKLEPDPARDMYALPDVLERVATVEVTREWKGPHKRSYTVASGLSSASCGYPFRLGEYLLLVFDDEPTRLDSCCGKGTISNMRLLIRALDKASRRKPLKIPDDLN
jgi:hypothetical protein